MSEANDSRADDSRVTRPTIEALSAITLGTHDMKRAVAFYRSLGFVLDHGGDDARLSTFAVGDAHLNIIAQPDDRQWTWWGRIIFHVSDVDALHAKVLSLGLEPEAPPRDAIWGERYFHLTDPDGHELSFARKL